MLRLLLSVLGGFSLRTGGGDPVTLPTKKSQALFAYLALRPAEIHPRDRLAALLWGDSAQREARHSLRQAILDLRNALPRMKVEIVRTERDGVVLNPLALDVDVAQFERLIAEGTAAGLAQAADLYRGELLEGLSVRDEPWEEWVRSERQRLRDLHVEALKKLLAEQTHAGANEAAIQSAVRLLAIDPLQEGVHRTLMTLYVRQGRRAAALTQYQTCLDVLRRELGVDPEAETQKLYREMVSQRPPSDRGANGTMARAAPRRPPATPHRRPRRGDPTAIPLIGRAFERTRLRQALREAWAGRGQSVAVLGPAGIGKTRLVEDVGEEGVRRGGSLMVGRCYETDQSFPFGCWIVARLGFLRSDDIDAFDPVWRAELSRLLPELGEAGGPTEPLAEHLRLFEAVVQVVAFLASRRPLVLVLEDLHWADEMTLRLLSFFGRRTREHAVLIVGTARDDELDGVPVFRRTLEEFDREDYLVRLVLPPFTYDDTSELIRVLAAARRRGTPLTGVSQQICTASDCN